MKNIFLGVVIGLIGVLSFEAFKTTSSYCEYAHPLPANSDYYIIEQSLDTIAALSSTAPNEAKEKLDSLRKDLLFGKHPILRPFESLKKSAYDNTVHTPTSFAKIPPCHTKLLVQDFINLIGIQTLFDSKVKAARENHLITDSLWAAAKADREVAIYILKELPKAHFHETFTSGSANLLYANIALYYPTLSIKALQAIDAKDRGSLHIGLGFISHIWRFYDVDKDAVVDVLRKLSASGNFRYASMELARMAITSQRGRQAFLETSADAKNYLDLFQSIDEKQPPAEPGAACC